MTANNDEDHYGMDKAFPRFIEGDNMPKSKLYYECHVTIEPLDLVTINLIRQNVAYYHFRIADLFMAKRAEDTPERSKYDTFMTGRDSNYQALRHNMIQLIKYLGSIGIKVWRYKIEDTVCDSKINDIYKLINNRKEWI